MIRRRGIFDHLAEVCEVSKRGLSISEIVFLVRLGGRNYKKVLDKALSSRLIKDNGGRPRILQTTERGEKYLKVYYGIQEMLKENRG